MARRTPAPPKSTSIWAFLGQSRLAVGSFSALTLGPTHAALQVGTAADPSRLVAEVLRAVEEEKIA